MEQNNSHLIRPKRPKILGIAHFSAFTDSLENAASLFSDYFGFAQPYYVKREGKPTMMFVKISDRQYVELTEDTEHRLVKYRHTAFEVDDAEGMRVYLEMMGLKVPAEVADPGFGFKCFFVKDFSGNEVEFVEYTDQGLLAEHKGKDMPDTRVSDIMRHVGWVCKDLSKELAFYGYILGFNEFWRGGELPGKSQWIKMSMPDSPYNDYIEIMLYDHELDQTELGCLNHISLDVEDVPATKELLDTRSIPAGCLPAEPQKVGACGYGQSNIYMIDKTRVEVMTKVAVGGKPTPSVYGVPVRFD